MSAHCWHFASAKVLPGKKRMALFGDRCCWCNAVRDRTVQTVKAIGHGPKVDVTEQVDVDMSEVNETCSARPTVTA